MRQSHATASGLLLALALTVTLACSTPAPAAPTPSSANSPGISGPGGSDPARRDLAPDAISWHSAGSSVEGRPIEYAEFGSGPATLLLLATIHGDEAAGTPLTHELARRLASRPHWLSGARVVLVPVANPDGLASSRRRNAHGIDLNRNFPSANWRGRTPHAEPLSEPESRALATLIERYDPDVVLSLHQPVTVIDYDGPAAELAAEVSAACSVEAALPVRRLGARPGSLGSWVGVDRGVPILTVELARSDDLLSPAQLWERYGAMLVRAITFTARDQDRR